MHRSVGLRLILLPLIVSVGHRRPGMMTRPTTPEVRRDEVRFVSGGLSLAGTITRPADGRRHPGVVILHAAGLDHRADYRVFADSLASWGIVVLAYDMRGTGDSGGKPGIPTFRQLSQDAIAALQLLRAQPDVDARNVGLWALSRGGYTAPLTAVADAGVRFLVVISSPGLPVSVSDSSALVEKAKEHELAAEDVARVERFAGLLLRAARKGGPDYQRLETEFSDVKTQPWFATLQIPAVPPEEALVRYGRTLAFDPDSLWRRVRVPTLLIYGSRDRPRLVRNSRTRILSALAAAGAHVDAPVYAEADHFIRVTREGGEPRFAAGFFASQQRWITANTR